MYLLVTGKCLFKGKNQSEIFEANKKCIIELDSKDFKLMDSDIKMLLLMML